ncbi:unnamed protein product [Prorocentrum cordatum]|uniref:Glycerophosphocholine acyltransferase 1 n=1 Tax=Prorocentrum cordatum TaxID=2364126 RepID=A0ABN9XE82_9DINO|nr:unnamed protein product [Polarella glacialis]
MWTRAHARHLLGAGLPVAAAPWLLRAGVLCAIAWGFRQACRGSVNYRDEFQDTADRGQVLETVLQPEERKIRDEEYHDLTWDQMRLRLGFRRKGLAMVLCVVRLILLHWLQAFFYWLALWAFYDVIGKWQFGLGFCVAIREGIYPWISC